MSPDPIIRSPSAYGYSMLIKRILETGLRRAPNQTVTYGEKRLTYRELEARVKRLASGLSGLGVEPGDTVAVMDWDSNRYLEAFFAVPMMGAVLHTVNIRLSPEQILYTINHAVDDVILVNVEFLPVLEQIWDRVERKPKLVLLREDAAVPATSLPLATDYESLLAGAAPDFVFPDLNEDARATTFYTTGTTGLPKGVYFSHRQLVAHTLGVGGEISCGAHGRFDADDVYMPITPMFHVHAWGFPYIATMLGARQVYPGRVLPEKLLNLIETEKVTFTHGVPTILNMMLAHPRAASVDLSRLKMIIGGASLPQSLAKEALERGIDVFTGYGMSETCPILTLSRLKPEWMDWDLDRQAEIRCKTGRPVRLADLRIVDDEMNDLPHDGVSQGEIVVRAPWLTQGYLHDPENSEKLWTGGWLHTGDIGVIDEHGYVKVTDRLKDVIKTGGEWISSLDVEDILLKSGKLAEAAVIGVPDPKWTERPLAVVVAKSGAEVSEADLKAHLLGFAERGLISRYAAPDRIVFVDELPKTSVGKLDKKLMRATYGA